MAIVGCSMPSGGQGAKAGHSPCWSSNDGDGSVQGFHGRWWSTANMYKVLLKLSEYDLFVLSLPVVRMEYYGV